MNILEKLSTVPWSMIANDVYTNYSNAIQRNTKTEGYDCLSTEN